MIWVGCVYGNEVVDRSGFESEVRRGLQQDDDDARLISHVVSSHPGLLTFATHSRDT